MVVATNNTQMHPRNLHKNGYPMAQLCRTFPPLASHVVTAKSGQQSINFSNPDAVLALNTALLMHYYGLSKWSIPSGYLCPPVPGRADYIHAIADLLAKHNGGEIPTGECIRGLDIGVGANAIYPIIGSQVYGWRFVGSDIDPLSVKSATALSDLNPSLKPLLTVRQQQDKQHIFAGIVKPDETFDFSLCNPPFHKSRKDAALGSQRKNQGLLRNQRKRGQRETKNASHSGRLNFAGVANELWCDGGELAFIQRMISESVEFKSQITWFTCLVSKSAHLPAIERSIKHYAAKQYLKIEMGQGQKKSRFVAWTYQ